MSDRAETSQTGAPDDAVAGTSQKHTRRERAADPLLAAVRAGQMSLEEAESAWCDQSWMPPDGVIEAFIGPKIRIRMSPATRRRTMIRGTLRSQDGRTVAYVPDNPNGRRREDRVLLDQVASLVGISAVIPRSGRPRTGIGFQAARWIHSQPEADRAIAVERAAVMIGWAVDSMSRCYRRYVEWLVADPTSRHG